MATKWECSTGYVLEQTNYYLALKSMSRYFISKSREHNSPVCSRFPADYTDGPFISLAVEFEIFSVLFTFSIYFNGFRWWRTRTKALQIVQFGNKVLHQVVFSETPLVEYLRSKEGTLVTTFLSETKKWCEYGVFYLFYSTMSIQKLHINWR